MEINKKIFNDNFRFYYRPLCMYALHYVKDIDSAEDIVQDCFTEIWERKEDLANVSNMKAYLYTMVRNKCGHYLKERLRQEMTNEDISHLEYEANDEEYEERSFMEAKMLTTIENLPERCREALLLSRRDGLKHEEIAKYMSVSVNTVKNHINKALKIIKKQGRNMCVFFLG